MMSFTAHSQRVVNIALVSFLIVSCAEASAAEAPIALAPVGVTINTNTPPPTPRVSPTVRQLTQPPTRTLVPTTRPTNTLAPIGRPPVRPAVQAAAPTLTFTSAPQVARSGTIREIDVPSDVLSKLNTSASEGSASLGQTITVGGTVRTLDRGKARIDLNEGTVVRVAPKTLFTVTALNQDTLNPFTRLQLAFGKVFIILSGGRMEVETPIGSASVRGSFMSVEFNLALRQLTINCLETLFNCDLSYQGSIFNLLTLQKMVVPPHPPRIQPMDGVDIKEWLINVPNSPTVIPPTMTNPPPPTQAPAATATNTTVPNIVVNTLTDELNSDGDCSLREAIKAANTNLPVDACIPAGGSDTITFSVNGTITTGIAGTGEDAAATGDYDITESLTVIGNGAANTIISGNSVDRVFHILAGTVSLSEMTISNGNPGTTDDGGGVNVAAGAAALSNVTVLNNTAVSGGGVIVLGGSMTISGSTIKSNTATTAQGGGIFVETGATLTVYSGTIGGSSTADKNTAGNDGGGIFTRGTTLVTNSAVIQNNETPGNGGGVYVAGGGFKTENTTSIKGNKAATAGGGIYVGGGTVQIIKSTLESNSLTSAGTGAGIYNLGTLTIDKSTLDANTATTTGSAGGGLYNDGGTATINNSTFANNSVDTTSGEGGGIKVAAGTVDVSFSTIAKNTGSTSGGGGIKRTGGTLNIKNSIITDQTTGDNCVGTINSISGSYASDTTCTGTATAGLLTLTLTGTPAYYPLAAGSSAKDAITAANCTTIAGGTASPAQNGQTRPTNTNCDAGSVEAP